MGRRDGERFRVSWDWVKGHRDRDPEFLAQLNEAHMVAASRVQEAAMRRIRSETASKDGGSALLTIAELNARLPHMYRMEQVPAPPDDPSAYLNVTIENPYLAFRNSGGAGAKQLPQGSVVVEGEVVSESSASIVKSSWCSYC